MTTFTMRHDLECGEDRFWELFLDPEFNKKLFASLDFTKWEIVEQRDGENEVVRIIDAIPKLDAPAPVAKVLGPGFGYREEGRFDKTKKTFAFTLKPSTLEGKLRNEGTVRCESTGEGTCRRVVDIVVEAKVFGIGGMIESMTEKKLREGWAQSALFINRWVREKR